MGLEMSMKAMPFREYFHLVIDIQTCNFSCKGGKKHQNQKVKKKIEVKMNPVKVTERLPVDYEGALILLQMSEGLRWNEFEKKFPEIVREVNLRASALKSGAKSLLPAVKTEKASLSEALTAKENEETLRPTKRGRPNKSMVLAVKNGAIIPMRTASKGSSIVKVMPQTKKPISGEPITEMELNEIRKKSKEKELREHAELANLRLLTRKFMPESFRLQLIQELVVPNM